MLYMIKKRAPKSSPTVRSTKPLKNMHKKWQDKTSMLHENCYVSVQQKHGCMLATFKNW